MSRRVQMQLFNSTTQNSADYADLTTIGTLAGTLAGTITGTIATVGTTFAGTAVDLALKELQTKVNAILTALT
jgi:hypothetical protein